MLGTDRSDEDCRGHEGTALVPLVPALEWAHKASPPRPNPSFVTQLIANAEHVPQTSRLRRASSADARLAYSREPALQTVTARTRQLA